MCIRDSGITPAVWQEMLAGRVAGEAVRAAQPHPSEAVLALVAARQAARTARDWAESDRLRDELACQGWQVLDTPDGQVVNPLTINNQQLTIANC